MRNSPVNKNHAIKQTWTVFVDNGVDVPEVEASGEEDEVGQVEDGLVVADDPQTARLEVKPDGVSRFVRTPEKK